MDSFTLFGLAMAATAVCYGAFMVRRNRRSYADVLQEALSDYNLELIEETRLPLFDTGPFPFAEWKRSANADYVSWGDGAVYRKLRVRNPAGAEHTLWAKLTFESGELIEITWHPSPAGIAEMSLTTCGSTYP